MKNKIVILIISLCLVTFLPVFSFSGVDHIDQNSNIIVYKQTPEIDGIINTDEGWSSMGILNEDTAGYFCEDERRPPSTVEFYFAYSSECLYFAANMIETEENVYIPYEYNYNADDSYIGFYGDIISLTLDPNGVLLDIGSWSLDDRIPQYNFICESGRVYVINSIRPDGYPHPCYGEGYTTDDGFCFEVRIPWDAIVEDYNKWGDSVNLEHEFTKQELIAKGASHRAAVFLQDYYYCNEGQGQDGLWGYYATVGEKTANDEYGYDLSESSVKWYGLSLKMASSVGYYERVFEDVPTEKWYYDSIMFCYHYGYMAGMSGNYFGAKENVTRAMFVTILSKIDGSDTTSYSSAPFKDVESGKWYTAPVAWAAEQDYVAGIGSNQFGPSLPVTREQLAQFLYNYSVKKGYVDIWNSFEVYSYKDHSTISDWAFRGMAWATAQDLISGMSNGQQVLLAPKEYATRAQIAQIVENYMNMILEK